MSDIQFSLSHKLNSTIPGTLSLPTKGDIGKGFVVVLTFDGPGGNKYAFNISKGDSQKMTLYDMTGSRRLWEIQPSLDRLDGIVVSSGIGSVGFSWKRVSNEYRLYFHVDGTKVAYLTATFPEQRLSLGQIFQTEGKDILNDLNDAPIGLMPYAASYDSQNAPSGFGVVLTLGNKGNPGSTYWMFQLAFGTDGKLHHRTCVNSLGAWGEWVSFG